MANLRVLAILLLLLPIGVDSAHAKEVDAEAGDAVAWVLDLKQAFAKAKADDKVLMICVNAKSVAGRRGEEPAAKGLREVIYKDSRVIAGSRKFVCAFLSRDGSSGDYGELRALGIEGNIVSPQHIFVTPAGDRILARKEYWSYGKGESGVKALLDMMESAAQANRSEPPAPEADAPEAPAPENAPDAEERAAWIARMLAQVRESTANGRRAALQSLMENDQQGDCIDPLIAMLPELAKEGRKDDPPVFPILADVIRALGMDGLGKAAQPIADRLKHDEVLVRANAAVSLEHIGAKDKAITKTLRSRLTKEKDVCVARHIARALGRCGAGDSKCRQALVKVASKMDDREWSFGALIGLAYFEGDAKAARSIEKILQKLGPPQGRRGDQGFKYYTQRALSVWALGHIGNEKSIDFIRKTLIEPAEKANWEWKRRILEFYGAVVDVCAGEKSEDVVGKFNKGLRYYLERLDEEEPWKDEARQGRDASGFEPLADWDIDRRG
ncbi:MAG: hypothetical protein GY946_31135 [bacterium]|nr:hypothetical protein [bacterium]